MDTQHEYEVVMTPAPEGGFVVSVPDLPDVHTEGETREEALVMVKDAIEGYLETMRERGWSVRPADCECCEQRNRTTGSALLGEKQGYRGSAASSQCLSSRSQPFSTARYEVEVVSIMELHILVKAMITLARTDVLPEGSSCTGQRDL